MAKNWSSFKVESPEVYDSYPLSTPEQELSQKAAALREEMRLEPPTTKPKRAVWIVHGMGQQVPFATLEQLANGLTMAAKRWTANKIQVSDPDFREVQVGKTVLQRVELQFTVDNNPAREVDLYECYWAPKTEGAVKLKDVIGFLWDGGSRGLFNCFSKFQRALFGTMVPFRLNPTTPLYLLLTLGVLGALLIINAIIAAVGGKLIGLASLPEVQTAPLTAIAAIISAVAITFGVVLFVAASSLPLGSKAWWGHLVRNVVWFSVGFTILCLVLGAALMAAIFWGKCVPAWLSEDVVANLHTLINLLIFLSFLCLICSRVNRRYQVSKTELPGTGLFGTWVFYAAFAIHLAVLIGTIMLATHSLSGKALDLNWVHQVTGAIWSAISRSLNCVLGQNLGDCVYRFLLRFATPSAWVWPFLVLISAVVRQLLVQYVGDVTAYVTSNKVDHFDELRAKIKSIAKESLTAVFSAKPKFEKRFEYDKVAIVGHSLGSVIAYDTLNRLIADDRLSGNPASVVKRTNLLLTFGSPLDKTAFFFSVMGRDTSHIREQLAAVVQPLIEDIHCRELIPWTNVYSRNDIIAGSLDFYDFPADAPEGVPNVRKVFNVKDENALIPLVAHVEYWNNITVWKELLRKVLDV